MAKWLALAVAPRSESSSACAPIREDWTRMTATRTAPSTLISRFLGEIIQAPGSELFVPNGLPGFEHERNLLPVEIPAHRPLVFLQSTTDPETCFVCLPVSSIAS